MITPGYLKFKACDVHVFGGYCETVYPDGARVRSENFDEQVARDYGYSSSHEFCVQHEIIHHFVAEKLGRNHSPNQWLLAHGAQPTDQHRLRDLEENVVAGFTFLLNQDRLPIHDHRSWTRTPELYVIFAEKVFQTAGVDINLAVAECRHLLSGLVSKNSPSD